MREVLYRGRLLKVSDYAKFLATDKCGYVFEYSLNPRRSEYLKAWYPGKGGRLWRCISFGNNTCHDWEESLFEIEGKEQGND